MRIASSLADTLPVEPWEVAGTSAGLLSVVLTIRLSPWCWPTGILSVAAYAVLFFRIRLYADAALQLFFVATSLYGWYAWRYGGVGSQPLRVRALSMRARLTIVAVLLPASALVAGALSRWTDASLPWWDVPTTLLSVTAQLLLMRKVLENWLCWIAVDLLSIGLYLAKGVYLTAGLYGVFLVLAVLGFREWRSAWRTQP
jgi:nicotinamide mononucleotide transporter